MKPLLILNMHTQDKPAMAEEGARHALRLATMVYVSVLCDPKLNKCQDLEQEACEIKKRFEEETGLYLLFALFYI